jgi:hypothetical protein
MFFPDFIIAGNAHDVTFILVDHILVLIYQSLSHSVSVFSVHTEEYGLIKSQVMLF